MNEFSSLNGYAVKDATARNIAKGRNQAVSFNDYVTMIAALNSMDKDEYKIGQNIYIGTVGVPDLWVYSVESIAHTFDYVSDEDIVAKLEANTTIQAGNYKLAPLEGQKVDMTTYDNKIAELEGSIVKYNNDTDMLDVYYNGVVVGSLNCGFQFDGVLYDDGVVNERYFTLDFVVTDENGANSVINTTDNAYMLLSVQGSENYPNAHIMAYMNKEINLSNFNYLDIVLSGSLLAYTNENYPLAIGFGSEKGLTSFTSLEKYLSFYKNSIGSGTLEKQTVTLDASQLDGNYYLYLYLGQNYQSSGSATGKGYIYELKLRQ
ncbi:MAG: hypothetical protein E7288_10500 [Lachnospiraceae bacterium]|nr:hypothetical protein [Lachnospiraceae bacterium]